MTVASTCYRRRTRPRRAPDPTALAGVTIPGPRVTPQHFYARLADSLVVEPIPIEGTR